MRYNLLKITTLLWEPAKNQGKFSQGKLITVSLSALKRLFCKEFRPNPSPAKFKRADSGHWPEWGTVFWWTKWAQMLLTSAISKCCGVCWLYEIMQGSRGVALGRAAGATAAGHTLRRAQLGCRETGRNDGFLRISGSATQSEPLLVNWIGCEWRAGLLGRSPFCMPLK